MSHNQNTKLLEQYLDTLTLTVVCPYCGNPNQLDPPRLCCGEVHAQYMYDDGSDLFSESELTRYFKAWLLEQPEDTTSGYAHDDPMTTAKDYEVDHEDN